MKKNGFTLVELLAVIAILAILVIVAMPNVLEMFNEAKQNTFITEVQKIMDSAKGEFTSDAFNMGGKTVYYSSTDNNVLGTSKLDIDAPGKEYFIEMDRNGEFKRVVIYDSNYCYDIYDVGGSGNVGGTKSKKMNDIKKSSVNINDLWESGNDSINVSMDSGTYKISGCEAIKNVKSDSPGVPVVPETPVENKVTINGVQYNFSPGMTWGEWINNAEYNLDNYKISGSSIYKEGASSYSNTLRYSTPVYLKDNVWGDYSFPITEGIYYKLHVLSTDEIINGESYILGDDKTGYLDLRCSSSSGVPVGNKYLDFTQNGGNVIYNQEYLVSNDSNFGIVEGCWD